MKLSVEEEESIGKYRQFGKMRRALENCSMLARREKRKAKGDADAWGHIIRFCEEAGIRSRILRGRLDSTDSPTDGGVANSGAETGRKTE